tara:strand:+ start:211 stop:756 length:546 start_codon:yes stop_codon:yes gene_type:complete
MNYLPKALMASFLIGVASIGSFASIKGGMLEQFKLADGNRDGLVTHDEMMVMIQKKFNEFDKNGDGFLELNELPKEMPVSDMMQKRMGKRLKKMAKRHDGNEIQLRDHIEERFKVKHSRINYVARHDADGDERVSVEEFAGRKIKHFKRADQNGDGNVTLAELDETSKKMQHHHRKMKNKR